MNQESPNTNLFANNTNPLCFNTTTQKICISVVTIQNSSLNTQETQLNTPLSTQFSVAPRTESAIRANYSAGY